MLQHVPRSGILVGKFRASEINADILPELTKAALEKLGLPLGHRKRLLRAISGLTAAGARRIDRCEAPGRCGLTDLVGRAPESALLRERLRGLGRAPTRLSCSRARPALASRGLALSSLPRSRTSRTRGWAINARFVSGRSRVLGGHL
jgi:hypothetical protein